METSLMDVVPNFGEKFWKPALRVNADVVGEGLACRLLVHLVHGHFA